MSECRPKAQLPECLQRSWLLPDHAINESSTLLRLLGHLQKETCEKRSCGHRRPAPNLRTFSFFLTRRYKKLSPFSSRIKLVSCTLQQLMLLIIQNRLQQKEHGPSGYSSPPSASSFCSVVCRWRGELLCDLCYTNEQLLFFSLILAALVGNLNRVRQPQEGGMKNRSGLREGSVLLMSHRVACS